jgi:fructosamine-3-kinase
MMWETICKHISQVENLTFDFVSSSSVKGGCINQSYRLAGLIADSLESNICDYFVKLNSADRIDMFRAEALGLNQILQLAHCIRVPRPICMGLVGMKSYLVMEWLDLQPSQADDQRELGRSLATLHKSQQITSFGWDCDNTIGSTLQMNSWTKNWGVFWKNSRIEYQIELAYRKGKSFSNSELILNAIPILLSKHYPQPSLVHGDLWYGNMASLTDGTPVVFDPAVYWGDREVDLAMTELFGGFREEFYAGYNEVWPLDDGYQERKHLYNLYHILNHFNIFGPFKNDESLNAQSREHILNHFSLCEEDEEDIVEKIISSLLRLV